MHTIFQKYPVILTFTFRYSALHYDIPNFYIHAVVAIMRISIAPVGLPRISDLPLYPACTLLLGVEGAGFIEHLLA